jgi:hypothetical protein
MAENHHFVGLNEEDFIKEALNIVSKAKEKNIVLRIMGGLAVRLHIKDDPLAVLVYKKRFDNSTNVFADLDLVGYRKQRGDIEKMFVQLQYQPDRMINPLFGDRRLIFYHPKGYFHIDVFLDKLEFSHDVFFYDKQGIRRLEISFPAITPTDIILGKLQIHQINKKDLIDLIALFAKKNITSSDEDDSINGSYIAKILSQDWGFWYEATNNLNMVKYIAKDMLAKGDIQETMYDKTLQQIGCLLQFIEKEPKTKDWIKRSQVGTKKPWYREVSDIF